MAYQPARPTIYEQSDVDKSTLSTLTLFFGWLGSHKFYVRQTTLGALYFWLTVICSSLILSGHQFDYIAWGQLEFRENSGAFRLTLSENRLGLHEKSLITSGAAWIR
jgi:TM2 domain-containing membrane protein YozV